MLAIVLFVIVCVFVVVVAPPTKGHPIRPYNKVNYTIGFIVCLFGVALIYIAFKTDFTEKVTSNVILRTIIKIMLTIAGVAIIWFGLNIN